MSGSKITIQDGRLVVPDDPIIPFIEGDGVGPDIWRAAQPVWDRAVERAYGGRRFIVWKEVLAGEKAYRKTGQWLPEETLQTIREHIVAIKGPLTTPVGGGYRSLNVAIRQALDLYACIRPIRHIEGVPSPLREPWKVDLVIFRENTEDVYAGIEWPSESEDARAMRDFLRERFGVSLREDTGIGLKPISRFCTQRLVRKAINYALEHGRRSVTLVHKGNIMKYTEGAFRDWGYEVAREFGSKVVLESEIQGEPPDGVVLVKDRIADSMFQQVLLRPEEYDVIATSNLNGDYLSDACAAQVGGLGIAPGANVGDFWAVFEPTHGTAPKYAGLDRVNPSSLILSGAMMLEYIGWKEAADLVVKALERTIAERKVTYDLARQMEDATLLRCSEFGEAVMENVD